MALISQVFVLDKDGVPRGDLEVSLTLGEETVTFDVAPPAMISTQEGETTVETRVPPSLVVTGASVTRVDNPAGATNALTITFTVSEGTFSTLALGLSNGTNTFLGIVRTTTSGEGVYTANVPLSTILANDTTPVSSLDAALTWMLYITDAANATRVIQRQGTLAARTIPCLCADTLVLRGDGVTWTRADALRVGDDVMCGDARVVNIQRVVSRIVSAPSTDATIVESGTLFVPRACLSGCIDKRAACAIPAPSVPCAAAAADPRSSALSAFHCVWVASRGAWEQVCKLGDVDAPRLPAGCVPSDARPDGSYELFHFVLPDGARDTLVLPGGIVAEALLWDLPPAEEKGDIRTPDVKFPCASA